MTSLRNNVTQKMSQLEYIRLQLRNLDKIGRRKFDSDNGVDLFPQPERYVSLEERLNNTQYQRDLAYKNASILFDKDSTRIDGFLQSLNNDGIIYFNQKFPTFQQDLKKGNAFIGVNQALKFLERVEQRDETTGGVSIPLEREEFIDGMNSLIDHTTSVFSPTTKISTPIVDHGVIETKSNDESTVNSESADSDNTSVMTDNSNLGPPSRSTIKMDSSYIGNNSQDIQDFLNDLIVNDDQTYASDNSNSTWSSNVIDNSKNTDESLDNNSSVSTISNNDNDNNVIDNSDNIQDFLSNLPIDEASDQTIATGDNNVQEETKGEDNVTIDNPIITPLETGTKYIERTTQKLRSTLLNKDLKIAVINYITNNDRAATLAINDRKVDMSIKNSVLEGMISTLVARVKALKTTNNILYKDICTAIGGIIQSSNNKKTQEWVRTKQMGEGSQWGFGMSHNSVRPSASGMNVGLRKQKNTNTRLLNALNKINF